MSSCLFCDRPFVKRERSINHLLLFHKGEMVDDVLCSWNVNFVCPVEPCNERLPSFISAKAHLNCHKRGLVTAWVETMCKRGFVVNNFDIRQYPLKRTSLDEFFWR